MATFKNYTDHNLRLISRRSASLGTAGMPPKEQKCAHGKH